MKIRRSLSPPMVAIIGLLSPLKEMPISLFFLDDSLGWMVTTRVLWRTTEAGRNWTKLPKIPDDILRVCFTSEKDGYAVG